MTCLTFFFSLITHVFLLDSLPSLVKAGYNLVHLPSLTSSPVEMTIDSVNTKSGGEQKDFIQSLHNGMKSLDISDYETPRFVGDVDLPEGRFLSLFANVGLKSNGCYR